MKRFFGSLVFALALAACNSSGGDSTSPDGGATADAGSSADRGGGLKQFTETCSSNADCATGLCYNFNARGMRCTQRCPTAPATCPPVAGAVLGCNGMTPSVCKTN
jgi:hypothetical protein